MTWHEKVKWDEDLSSESADISPDRKNASP